MADCPYMASLIEFAEEVRVLQDLPGLNGVITLAGTERDDVDKGVVPQALGVRVGQSCKRRWRCRPWWSMFFDDRLTARRVGIVLGLDWCPTGREVRLPWPVVDLEVAASKGLVESDEMGWLAGWWVPDDPKGEEELVAGHPVRQPPNPFGIGP